MKKLALILSLLLLGFLFLAPALRAEILPGQPAQIEAEGTPLRKLQRGFLNIVLCWMDISAEMEKEKKADTTPPGWLVGMARGAGFAAGRAVTGAVEMVTFFMPLPADYAPMVYPEFPWERLPADKPASR